MVRAADSNRTELPSDLHTILDDLEKADADARRLMNGLTDAQANWQPDANRWSIAQCLDHMTRVNAIYVAALREASQRGRAEGTQRQGPILPGWFGRYFLRMAEPPPRTKFRAPKNIVPRPRGTAEGVLQEFLRSQEDVRQLVRESTDLDLNRIRFRNPVVRLFHFTVGTGLLVIAAHDRRHLWQAGQIREAAGFPAR
jgi:hypothetical protein